MQITLFKEKIRSNLPGLILVVIFGYIASYISQWHKAADSLVIAILLGMILRFFIGERPVLAPGFNFASSIFIPLGIIFYGINLRFDKLTVVPAIAWLQLLVGIVIVFAVSIYIGDKFKMSEKSSLLIAIGTAICGASAIVILIPMIEAEREETSVSLLTITVWAVIGTLFCFLIQSWVPLTETGYSLLCATTLHMTGFVKIAASYLGNESLSLALSIKMARTVLIIPVLIAISWLANLRHEGDGERRFFSEIPWFMYFFFIVGLLFSFSSPIQAYAKILSSYATIFFTVALTSIGFMIDIKNIVPQFGRALMVGLAAWLSITTVFMVGYFLIGY